MTPNNPPRAHNPRCAICIQPCDRGIRRCPRTGEFACDACLVALSINRESDSDSRRGGGWRRGLLKIGLLAKIAPVFSRLVT